MPNGSNSSVGPVILLYNRDSTWPEADQNNVTRLVNYMLNSLLEHGVEVRAIEVHSDLDELGDYDPESWLVFNWSEGFEGMPWSDSLVAKELEQRGFVFTGASSRILRHSVNKEFIKRMLFEGGVPTPPGRAMYHHEAKTWHMFPAMVKPVAQHCSFGVSRGSVVESQAELVRQICRLEDEFGDRALVEPFIDGREFHVAVWGNRRPQALPPVELDYSRYPDIHDRLYTFESKFNPSSSGWTGINWICPAPDDPELRRLLQDVAVAAFRATRCRDYARMDIRLWNGVPMVLDVNPNADLDPESVIPIAAQQMGLNYGGMALQILSFASERLRRKVASRRRRLRKVVEEI